LCNSCASLAGLVLSFIACFILLVIAPLGAVNECGRKLGDKQANHITRYGIRPLASQATVALNTQLSAPTYERQWLPNDLRVYVSFFRRHNVTLRYSAIVSSQRCIFVSRARNPSRCEQCAEWTCGCHSERIIETAALSTNRKLGGGLLCGLVVPLNLSFLRRLWDVIRTRVRRRRGTRLARRA